MDKTNEKPVMLACSMTISVRMWSPSTGLPVAKRKACEARCNDCMLLSVSRLRRENANPSIRTVWQSEDERVTGFNGWLENAPLLTVN